MSALAAEPHVPDGYGWEETVRIWEETDVPEGCTVEIIEGLVTVVPPPSKGHNATAELLQRRLYAATPDDWGVYQTLGLAVPRKGGMYIPDLVVVPRTELAGPGNSLPAEKAELVVEITSPANANHDRIAKVHGYAAAGVPLYLLLDPCHAELPTATLYGEPKDGTYRTLEAVEYGEKLTLPEPFSCELDTSVLPLA